MNNDVTEIVAVFDKSGSMGKIKSDVIGGFNEFLKGQQELEGEANLTLVLFDTNYKIAYKGVPIRDVQPLNEDTYVPGGWTALLDAVGISIHETKERLSSELVEPKVIFLIMTDGEENKSREYQRSQIFDSITEQTEKGWEFIFLGANQDAIQEGGHLGITADKAYTYSSDARGTRAAYSAKIGTAVAGFRATGELDERAWKSAGDSDD